MGLSERLVESEPVTAAIAEARVRWPEIAIDASRVATWIEARLDGDAPSLDDALAKLHLVDIILACACATGDSRALGAFDAAYVAADTRMTDDLKQQLRVRLFVGDSPRIATYGGRGTLASWVKAVATRIAIDALRAQHEVSTEDAMLDAIELDASRGPVRDVLKAEARTVMQTALREALAELSALERTLLLQYYIDGVGVVELGKLHGLAASNISRRLAKTRSTLLAHMKRSLMRNHRLAGNDLDSVIDLVRSQLSVTGGLRG
jgi:RNA polymerase sigma-70 factor, ECF subfamily